MVVASVAWLVFGRGGRTGATDLGRTNIPRKAREREPVAVTAPTLPKGALPPPVPPASAPDVPPGDVPSGDVSSRDMSPEEAQEITAAWSAVDMEEVRQAMPDNLYWKLSVPTKDPRILEEREAERARRNVEYGKILSGTGTEDEIRAYYDLRARISGDYIEFATYLLDHYSLPERDAGLLKLALRLHRARLEEIPRKIEEAFERKRAQDAAREAWLADQATFGGANPDSPPSGE